MGNRYRINTGTDTVLARLLSSEKEKRVKSCCVQDTRNRQVLKQLFYFRFEIIEILKIKEGQGGDRIP